MSFIDKIPNKNREAFLKMITDNYVDQLGLGAMPKADLDALFVYAFLNYSDTEYSNFELSEIFKIKESRVRSLRVLGEVKFENPLYVDHKLRWVKIFKCITESLLEVDSIDKSNFRFRMSDPALYRYLNKEIREFGGHSSYVTSSERVVMSYQTFSKMIDRVWLEHFTKDVTKSVMDKTISKQLKNFKVEADDIKDILDENSLTGKIDDSIKTIGSAASIGKFILALSALF